MAQKRDYYEVLGVSKDATKDQIKRAYRKLAKKYHPDSNPGDQEAKKKFEEVNEAYEVLGDDTKRKQYDQFGFSDFGQGGPGAGGFGGFGSGSYTDGNGTHYYYSSNGGPDMGDVFGDIFGDMFGSKSGRKHRSAFHFDNSQDFGGGGFGGFRNAAEKGQDVTSEITIGFDEAANGGDRMIRVAGADGRNHTYKVHIPAGIDEGQSIRLKGKGNPSASGGEAGDLFLKVHISERPGFERKGQDIYVTARVPFITACLGGEAKVETMTGNVMLKIPAGTQSGSRIRLRGKGIVSMHNSAEYGDEYAVIEVEVPVNLSADAISKLKEFDAAAGRSGEVA